MAKKGKYTKPNIWDKAARLKLSRGSLRASDKKLDPGVNYFVAMLEQMGLETFFSCEGHPNGFYVTFAAPYLKAIGVGSAGFFSVEIEGKNRWALRISRRESERGRVDCLRWASKAWEKRFGPLDFKKIASFKAGLSPSMCTWLEGTIRQAHHTKTNRKRRTP